MEKKSKSIPCRHIEKILGVDAEIRSCIEQENRTTIDLDLSSREMALQYKFMEDMPQAFGSLDASDNGYTGKTLIRGEVLFPGDEDTKFGVEATVRNIYLEKEISKTGCKVIEVHGLEQGHSGIAHFHIDCWGNTRQQAFDKLKRVIALGEEHWSKSI